MNAMSAIVESDCDVTFGFANEQRKKLEKERADILDDIDMHREMMALMSPELAANIDGMIKALEQRVADIDDFLGKTS